MKIEILQTCILLMFIVATGCQKEEIEFADESIVVDNQLPGVSVYKTRQDYLNNIIVTFTQDGEINVIPSITENDENYGIDKNGKVKAKFRHLLRNGYVVGGGRLNGAYTNITFDEYIAYNKKHGVIRWPPELIEPRIIDRDPYLEYFVMVCHNCPKKEFTLGEIYEMLENGTIEEHFTRLK